MKPASKKRSTRAVKLILVSSTFILHGCRDRKEPVQPQMSQEQILLAAELEQQRRLQQQEEGLLPPDQPGVPPVGVPVQQSQPVQPVHHSSGWSYFYPPFWSYGSNSNRSWSSGYSSGSNNFHSSSSSYRPSSGPASHFGAQNTVHSPTVPSSPSHLTPSHTTTTIHSTPSHSTSTHTASSSTVSHGGFGAHGSSASS